MNLKKIRLFDLWAIFLLMGVIMLLFNVLITKTPLGKGGGIWTTVYIKLNNQPPWVDEAIKIGDSEFLGEKEIAKILDKKSVPAEAVMNFEVHWLPSPVPRRDPKMVINLPVYKDNRDITLKVKLLANKGVRGNLEYKNQDLRVNEPVEIQTNTINIRGLVMSSQRQ